MKHFLISTLLLIIAAFLVSSFLPWFSIVFSSFLIGYFYIRGHFNALLAGFLAVFILYCLQAWWIDNQNQGILSARISEVFGVSDGMILAVIGGVLGGLLSGLSAGTGTSLRAALKKKVK
jgi:hypothetical protein